MKMQTLYGLKVHFVNFDHGFGRDLLAEIIRDAFGMDYYGSATHQKTAKQVIEELREMLPYVKSITICQVYDLKPTRPSRVSGQYGIYRISMIK